MVKGKVMSQKVKVSPGTLLNAWKYNACDKKLERKLTSLHKNEVEKISYYSLYIYAVPDF